MQLKSVGTKTDFTLDVFPFASHSSNPKVILGCQESLQEKFKKQDLIP